VPDFNGVDTAQFSPLARLALHAEARRRRGIRETDLVLLLIGNDWRIKGLETVLRAMGALRELPILVIAAGDDSPDCFRETANPLAFRSAAVLNYLRKMFSISTRPLISMSLRALKIPSVCRLPKPWLAACPSLLPCRPAWPT